MEISVKIFSLLRERMGQDSLPLQIAEKSTAAEVVAVLGNTYPELSEYLPFTRLAINCTYSNEDDLVQSGDEVAVLLPASGG